MAYPTLTMRKIREVLCLHFDCGFKQREIARAVDVSPTTVGQYVRRMQRAGLNWSLSATLSDDELEARLYSPPPLLLRLQELNRSAKALSHEA
ncbi:transposase [Burkholderia pseudomallei]|nr:transposase [Burkholderia pseudomallei]